MLKYSRYLLLLMLVFTTVVGAQSTILSRYVEEGIDNNLGLLKETLALEQKQSAVRQARGLYLPDVTFHANYTWADGGRSIDFPVGDLFNPIYSTLNGLTGSANFPTNLENQEIQLLPDDFHETKLQIIQPIFNSDIYFNYRAQRDLVDVQAAQREAFISELTKEIKSGYFQYLQSEAVLKIFDQTMVVLKELRRVNTRLVEAQKATKDVISTSDFEISELEQKIAVAQKNRNLAKAYFNFLLNRELESVIESDSSIAASANQTALADAKALALQQRPELRQILSAQNAAGKLRKMNQASFLPKIFAAGEAGYQGYQYKFNDSQDYWLVRVGLEWNLFNGFQTTSKIQQSKIEEKRLKTQSDELEKQIQLQVIEGFYGVQAAQAAVQSAQNGERAASESFRIIKRKYEEGQALLVEFLDARNKLTNAQLSLAIARYDLLIQQASFERAIGN